jgi:hypothetical protein
MSKAVQGIIEDIAILVIDYYTFGFYSTIGRLIEYAAVAALLNNAEKALSPTQKSGLGAGLQSSYYSSEASIRVIYGQIKASGMQTIPPITYGNQGEFLASVLTVAGIECATDPANWEYIHNGN